MINAVLGNNWIIYSFNVQDDTAEAVFPNHGNEIPHASKYFAKLVEDHVRDDYRNKILELLDPARRLQIYSDKNDYELVFRLKDDMGGVWMRCETEISTKDDAGAPEIIDVIIKNIDRIKKRELEEERRRAERELMSNRAFESSQILKFTYYVKEGYGIASKGLMRRGAPEKMEGMPQSFKDLFVHRDHQSAFDKLLERCMAGEPDANCTLQDQDGRWMRLSLEAIEYDDEGTPTVLLGILNDTDELHRLQAEAAMIQNLSQFAVESHYEEADLIDVTANAITTVLEADLHNNVGFRESGATTFDEEVSILIEHRAVTDHDREVLQQMYLENLVPLLEANERHSIRVLLKTNKGEERWKSVEFVFFRGDHTKILMLGSDVHIEEMSKIRLREAAEEARNANRAKSAFLANMSHEIRTPMNAIVGICEILLNRKLPDDVLEKLNTIQNSGNSLLGIINDILDFSKIETGKLEVHDTEYMLPSLLMDISNVITVRLSSQPIYFMMDLDPSLPSWYVGDDIRIKQILINLLGNAVKFTREGYIQLKVEGRPLDDGRIEMTFEVKDTGIGIREEDIGKLFQTFSQVDTKRNRGVSGSGLGLTISRDLARMMGGDLTAESVYGKGSTFTVRIIQGLVNDDIVGEVQNKNVRILLCEQNETIIYSLSRTFEKLGVSFEVCREPEAIRSFTGMTHVLVRRRSFPLIREKLEFMFRRSNIFLLLENDEHANSSYMDYKQLQLPLISMQLINALNGEAIVTSVKSKVFDRSQIVPLKFARVLIVDDNSTNLQVAQGLMSPYQMKVDVASNGFRAIEMIKSVHYNAVFMDHMMPDMDGIEATRYIRNLAGDYFKTVPIIALTANAMSDAREMFEAAGMDDFVAKPIEMAELNRVLKRYVQSQAPEGYLEEVARKQNPETPAEGSGNQAQAASAASKVPGLAAGLPALPALDGAVSPQGNAAQQLLAQNNALLSQNMMLLQALFGGQAQPAGFTPVPAAPEGGEPEYDDENFDFGEVEEPPALVDAEWEGLFAPIAGVDMNSSLDMYGGSVSIYHNILKTYYYDLCTREPQLQEFFDARDTESFTISVHALKSASYGVGARELGSLAEQLEAAGKADDWDAIGELYGEFTDSLRFIKENVGRYVENYLMDAKSDDREQVDGFSQIDKDRLERACEDMDYILVEDILREMNEKQYPEEQELKLLKLIGLCERFEYDQLEELIREL